MINCAVILVDVSPFFGAAISADASVVHPKTKAVLPFGVACIPALEMSFIKELLWSVLSTVYAKRWLGHFYRINAWGSVQESISEDAGEVRKVLRAILLVEVSPFFGSTVLANAFVVHAITRTFLHYEIAWIIAVKILLILVLFRSRIYSTD